MLGLVREWYIAAIGILLIAGGLYFASQQASDSGAKNSEAKQTITASSPPEGAKSPSAPGGSSVQQPPSAEAAPVTNARSAPVTPGTPVALPGVAQSAAPAADNHAANTSQPNIAQAPAPTPAPASQTGANTSATSVPIAGGDPAAGKLVFRKCQVCHSLEPGKDVLGPSLAGIIGRKSGAEPNYAYSPAMKDANLTWDAKTLDTYLDDPQKVVPGNKMPFPGLKTPQDRSDVIAFIAAPAVAQPSLPPAAAAAQPSQAQSNESAVGYIPDAKYTLRSGIAEGRMVYIGVGGAIDGKVNPVLTAAEGQVVQLTPINGEGAEHDIVFPDQDAKSPRVTGKGASTTIAFRATRSGDFVYFCSVPGHRQAGMEGQFAVTPRLAPQTVVEADISREPTDLPPPIGKRDPKTVRVDLLSAEVEGRLAEGTTFG